VNGQVSEHRLREKLDRGSDRDGLVDLLERIQIFEAQADCRLGM
jgi:hypothetical protein